MIYKIFACSLLLMRPNALYATDKIQPLQLCEDDSASRVALLLTSDQHPDVYLSGIPSLYISHTINRVFIRPKNNARDRDYESGSTYISQAE